MWAAITSARTSLSSRPSWKMLHDHVDNAIDEALIKYVEDRMGHDRRYGIDPEKIKNELGWYPETPFEEGIVKTIELVLEQRGMDGTRDQRRLPEIL